MAFSPQQIALVESARVRFTCKGCGKLFEPTRLAYNTYCSRECCFAHKSENANPNWTHWYFRSCAVCKAPFRSSCPTHVCCSSKECSATWSRERTRQSAELRSKRDRSSRECPECHKQFVPEYGDKRRKFCSHECLIRQGHRITK